MTDTYTPVLTPEQIDQIGRSMQPWQRMAEYARVIERAAIEAYQRQQWRPIETAPKDGTAVLVLLPKSDIAYAARFMDCWRMTWDHHRLVGGDAPRFWMPIPPAPEGS